MSETEEAAAHEAGDRQAKPPPTGRSGWQKAAQRYGPIAVVVALVAAAVLAFGRGGGDDDGGGDEGAAEATARRSSSARVP